MSRQTYARTIKHLAKSHGVTRKKARALLDGLFAIVKEGVKYDRRFSIPGVGVFIATTRKGRRIRNPVTKELMTLPETKSVRFRPAKRGVFARGGR